MKDDKNILIVVLIITLLAFCIEALRSGNHSCLSIQEQAEMLRDAGYELDYEAIDKFANAWDEYVAELDAYYYYDDYHKEQRL